ncbi:MAG: hypothetical protein IIC76_14150 [Bacteroidetes bacterium]|nr:hypothetical protein [Bacteroidota bacterium]
MEVQNYSDIYALEKKADKLKQWIKSARERLRIEYKEFCYKNGGLYFHLRHPGIHLNSNLTKLEDLPLTSKQKEVLEIKCDAIKNMKDELRDTETKIRKFYLGDDSTNGNTKYDYLETVEEDNPKIKPIVQEMLDKWYETEMIDSYTPIKELVKRVKPALIKKCGTLSVKTDTINSYVKYWRRIEGFTKTKRGKK